MPDPMLKVLIQAVGPDDCVLSGLCGIVPERWGPHPGVMFTAVGLVLLGVLGLRALRRRQRP